MIITETTADATGARAKARGRTQSAQDITEGSGQGSERGAERLFEVIPPIMQLMRHEMRTAVQGRLSITQFRVLARIEKGVRSSGELAEWIGVSLPALSRMVNGLVRRGLVKRARQVSDRRQISLTLTVPGKRFYAQVKSKARKSLVRQLSELTPKQNAKLLEALNILQNSLLNLEETHEEADSAARSALNRSLRLRS